VPAWTFLTNHSRVLICIAHDPNAQLREIASAVNITERTAYGIIADLVAGGYVVKERDGRRNHYVIRTHVALGEPNARDRTIGELLVVLMRPE
jgi:DNA-binding IclR family transcriptional regulator